MFDIKPEQLVSKTDKLLFSILQELKRLNALMCPVARDTKALTCKKCGEEFTNRGQFMAHMRKHKKEGE